MEVSNMQLGITIVLLAALVLISRLRDFFKSVSNDDYRKITAGLIVLTLSSVINLMHQKMLFTSLPFVSEQLFVDIVFWSANLTGMILLLSGVARWLPVYQKYLDIKYQSNKESELFRYVEQIIQIESRLNAIINNCVAKIIDVYKLSDGAALLYSHKYKRFHQCYSDATNLKLDLKSHALTELVSAYENGNSDKFTEIVKTINVTDAENLLSFPLEVDGKLCGLFILQQSSVNLLANNQIDNIKLIIDILSQKVKTDCLIQTQLGKIDLEKELSALESRINLNNSTRQNMSLIFEYLNKKFEYNFAMISIFNEDGTSLEYSVSDKTRSVLIKTNYPGINNPSLANYLKEKRSFINIPDLAVETEIEVDSYLLKSDMRSLIAFPVYWGNEIVGAFVMASQTADNYNSSSISSAHAISRVISTIIAGELNRKTMSLQTHRQSLINQLIGKLSYNIKAEAINQYAAGIIRDELDYVLVRISTFEDNFLVTRALALTDPERLTAPEEASLVLALMPAHQKIIKSGEPYYTEQNSLHPITASEQSQFFGEDLSRTLLYPIKQASQTVGVISLGDIDANRTLNRNDLSFLEAMSGILGVTWKKDMLSEVLSNRLLKTTEEKSNYEYEMAED